MSSPPPILHPCSPVSSHSHLHVSWSGPCYRGTTSSGFQTFILVSSNNIHQSSFLILQVLSCSFVSSGFLLGHCLWGFTLYSFLHTVWSFTETPAGGPSHLLLGKLCMVWLIKDGHCTTTVTTVNVSMTLRIPPHLCCPSCCDHRGEKGAKVLISL